MSLVQYVCCCWEISGLQICTKNPPLKNPHDKASWKSYVLPMCFHARIYKLFGVNFCTILSHSSLDKPQLNSTYGVKKQLEKLRIDQQRKEKDLKQIISQEDAQLNPINEKATAALNYKRKDEKYENLLPVDVDFERELEKAASKRTAYEAPTATQVDNQDLNDIMTFWTPDLVTDNPKLDYDKDIDPAILEPDIPVDISDYLTDLYFCKEVSSQFR